MGKFWKVSTKKIPNDFLKTFYVSKQILAWEVWSVLQVNFKVHSIGSLEVCSRKFREIYASKKPFVIFDWLF